MQRPEIVWKNLESVRNNSPLVHNITNHVVMNYTANAMLAAGASPVMAHALEEVADMAAIASALVINIGTLSPHWVDAMEKAMISARQKGIPIVVDPVGAGATPYRTNTVKALMQQTPPDIIRGNASEIGALTSSDISTKGVDSSQESGTSLQAAHNLRKAYGAVVVVSGQTDYIISETEEKTVSNGDIMMARVTGMGCAASALTAAFAGVNNDHAEAAFSAMAVMGIAGEMAAEKAGGPGSLQWHFLDALHNIGQDDILNRFKH